MHTKHLITNWVYLGAGFNKKTLGGVRKSTVLNVHVCVGMFVCVRDKERKSKDVGGRKPTVHQRYEAEKSK